MTKKLQGGAKGRDYLCSKVESKQSKRLLSPSKYKKKCQQIIVKHQVHRLPPKELLHFYQLSQTGQGEWLSGSPKILKVTIILFHPALSPIINSLPVN